MWEAVLSADIFRDLNVGGGAIRRLSGQSEHSGSSHIGGNGSSQRGRRCHPATGSIWRPDLDPDGVAPTRPDCSSLTGIPPHPTPPILPFHGYRRAIPESSGSNWAVDLYGVRP